MSPRSLLKDAALPHDDGEVQGSGQGRIEDVFGVDFLVESVDSDHHGWALEALESGDGAIEDVVGGPQVLPVGVAVGVAVGASVGVVVGAVLGGGVGVAVGALVGAAIGAA